MEMENNETPSKKTISPMMIGGILILLVVVVGAIVIMGKGSSKSGSETSNVPTMAPTVATQQAPEGSMTEEKKEAVKTFVIEGSNFKFSPNALVVNEGDTVKITFKNVQGFHDFVIDEFSVKTKTIPANQTDEVQFVASKKGSFEFYCSVGNHRAMGMIGKLTVQ